MEFKSFRDRLIYVLNFNFWIKIEKMVVKECKKLMNLNWNWGGEKNGRLEELWRWRCFLEGGRDGREL